jgi:hypothetical protein
LQLEAEAMALQGVQVPKVALEPLYNKSFSASDPAAAFSAICAELATA